MIQLGFPTRKGSPLTILCLGAHSDDIEIGCGGTILRLVEEHKDCVIHWVVFSASDARKKEAQQGAVRFAPPSNLNGPILKEFHDGFMPFIGAEIKQVFEELKRSVSPDVIFTHARHDAHQDHRLISGLTWSTFRDHFILEYEIPKYDGDLGRPNVFVPLKENEFQKKVQDILEVFQSQRSKRWFQEQTFSALMRLRGMECNAASGYAEAFYCRKVVL